MTDYGLQLIEMGYQPGARNPEIERLDTDVVARLRCRKCGGVVRYEAYHTATSYVALAVCDACGLVKEI